MATGHVKNPFYHLGTIDSELLPSALLLKVSFSQDRLRYFVLSEAHGLILYFGEYVMHHVADEAQLIQRIEKIYEKDETLQLPFGKVLLGTDAPYALFPAGFAFMKKAEDRLQWCAAADTNISFFVSEEMDRMLRRLFPRGQVLHLNSSLLHKLPEYVAQSTDRVFVNVHPEHFDVVVFRPDRTLAMMNRFEYKAETDFIYFLLLCCDELKINRETNELILLGEVSQPSKIYDVCYRYFKHISFISVPDGVSFSKDFSAFDKHRFFTLYNLHE